MPARRNCPSTHLGRDDGRYYSFAITNTLAIGVLVNGIQMDLRNESPGTGPTGFAVTSSADNFQLDLANGSLDWTTRAWVNVDTDTDMDTLLQPGQTLEFRVTGWGANSIPPQGGHLIMDKRTVERDMAELSRIFPIDRNEKSIPFGWHWMENARFDTLGMDLSEAVSLGLMEDVLRQIMPPAFLSALEGKFSLAREKLAALPKIPHARWKDLVRYVPPGMPFIPPAVAPGVLPAVQEALLRQRQLQIVYLKAGADKAKATTLHPLSLIQQGARSYLVATAFDYDNPILYAIHRFASAIVLEEPVKRPKGFSLDAYLESGAAQFACGNTITLKARVSDELARLLDETPVSKDQKITTRAGVHTLTATVYESWQLHFWILSQGPAITVLKPVALRKGIISRIRESLACYESSS